MYKLKNLRHLKMTTSRPNQSLTGQNCKIEKLHTRELNIVLMYINTEILAGAEEFVHRCEILPGEEVSIAGSCLGEGWNHLYSNPCSMMVFLRLTNRFLSPWLLSTSVLSSCSPCLFSPTLTCYTGSCWTNTCRRSRPYNWCVCANIYSIGNIVSIYECTAQAPTITSVFLVFQAEDQCFTF